VSFWAPPRRGTGVADHSLVDKNELQKQFIVDKNGVMRYNKIMEANKKIALYLRVSTSDQSTELQSSELLAYCKARGFNDVEIYEDIGRTGTNDNRPALKKLIADAKQRKFDIVICWKIDRLFRSLKHLILTLQEFDDLGIKFISLKDQIDLTTSSGRLLMQIIGAMSEFV